MCVSNAPWSVGAELKIAFAVIALLAVSVIGFSRTTLEAVQRVLSNA